MDDLARVAVWEGHRYEIVHEEGYGWYVFRYEHESGTRTTHDYLQDDLAMALECAAEEFGVPLEAWREAEPGESPAYSRGR